MLKNSSGLLFGALAALTICGVQPGTVLGNTIVSDTKTMPRAPVIVHDLKAYGSRVSGVVTNNSSNVVRNVEVLIHHTWFWNDERHPGQNSPGRASFYRVPGEIPPGGSIVLNYEDAGILPSRSDGYFRTSADVVGYSELIGDSPTR